MLIQNYLYVEQSSDFYIVLYIHFLDGGLMRISTLQCVGDYIFLNKARTQTHRHLTPAVVS